MKDKYDIAIEYLNDRPREIYSAWSEQGKNTEHAAHCLFTRVTPTGYDARDVCGCLTQIRRGSGGYVACTQELTEEIRKDHRLPSDPHYITVAHLPVFAEWQRRLDKELNRA